MLTWILSQIYIIGIIIAALVIIGMIASLIASLVILVTKNPKIYLPCVLVFTITIIVGCYLILKQDTLIDYISNIRNNVILYNISACLGLIGVIAAVLSVVKIVQGIFHQD